MAVETPDIVHAMAVIGIVDAAPTLLQSAGIAVFDHFGTGRYFFTLQDAVDEQNICVSVKGRKNFAPTCTHRIANDGLRLDVFVLGANNEFWDAAVDVVVFKLPSIETETLAETDISPPSNWDGTGAPSGPPSGTAGGDLGGTYPNPTVIALTDTSATRYEVGASLSEGKTLKVVSGDIVTGAPEEITVLASSGPDVPLVLTPGVIQDYELFRRVGTTYVGYAVPASRIIATAQIAADGTFDNARCPGIANVVKNTTGVYTVTLDHIDDYLGCGIVATAHYTSGTVGYGAAWNPATSAGNDLGFVITNELGVLADCGFNIVVTEP